MKTWKRIAVLSAVFVAAAVIYFLWPFGRGEEKKEGITYTAMEEASLPVVYPVSLGQEMAPLFGHREEKAVTAERDSLLVLPDDRRLSVRIAYGQGIRALSYEIRSMDMEHLVERTELSGWSAGEDGSISAELPIQNLLEQGEEYQLGIRADLDDGSTAWYYARILPADESHAREMLALAMDFSEKTMNYEDSQDLTMYMETDQNADNGSLGNVTLKNSFTQMTWGNLAMTRTEPVYVTLKEFNDDIAHIEIAYEASGVGKVGNADEEAKSYRIVENFTLKWTNQRIYMMDYSRTMNEEFSGEAENYSGKRIVLGISDGQENYSKSSDNGQFTAFVVNKELWCFDMKNAESVQVFAFGGAGDTDVRNVHEEHGVEILSVSDVGAVDFLVYGYMNRGVHEGETGIALYHYETEGGSLEERLFLAASLPYSRLKQDLELLAHQGENGSLYLLAGGTVYGIDLTSYEAVEIASDLTDERFAVSGDGSRLAWQENTGVYDSPAIYFMNLDTGSRTQIGGDDGNSYRILGFVGNDCVYGTGTAGDYITSNGRIAGLYLRSIDIAGMDGEPVHYEKPGSLISGVEVGDSRIHIRLTNDRSGGLFGAFTSDTLVCNSEALPGRMDSVGWYASDIRGRIYFIQLPADIPAGSRVRTRAVTRLASDGAVRLAVTPSADAGQEFYAYGRGRLLGRFTRFSEAAAAAYDSMGFVSRGRYGVIWSRAAKANAATIRDLQNSLRGIEVYRNNPENSLSVDAGYLLDAAGTPLTQVLYFVGKGIPVLAYTGEGSALYLYGYDQGHARIYYPDTGSIATWDMEETASYFSGLGNDFLCLIP